MKARIFVLFTALSLPGQSLAYSRCLITGEPGGLPSMGSHKVGHN